MDLIGYLRILRRRWKLVAGTFVLVLLMVWFTLPEQPTANGAAPAAKNFTATATLVVNPDISQPPNLAYLSLFVTAGQVPGRVADQIGFKGEPQELVGNLTVVPKPESNSMTISASGTKAREAEQLANTFAEQLIAFLHDQQVTEAEATTNELEKRLSELGEQRSELDAKLRRNPGDGGLIAQRAGVQALIDTAVSSLTTAEAAKTSPAQLDVLQRAVAVEGPSPSSATGGFTAPSSPRSRFLIGGVIGLLLGAGLALLVERLDSRLRGREEAEHAYQLPVLAEIPTLPWQHRHSVSVLSAAEPGSATAEAYRALRSAILLVRAQPAGDHASVTPTIEPAVIMVTSARDGEGKTTTVANLAVVLAETGRRVLVLSLDFRNPRLHRYLNVPAGAGLSDLLSAQRTEDLRNVVRDSFFPGVQVATSGQETGHPGALLTGVGPLINEARHLADIVLIDTAPLLSVSDAVELSPHVDAALVVSRVNRTTRQQAAACQRLLSRLGVPTLGLALVGHTGTTIRFDGYQTRSSLLDQISTRFGTPRRSTADPAAGRGQHAHTKGSTNDD